MAEEIAQIISGLKNGDVAPYVFMPGDPGRVPKISAAWDSFEEIVNKREYIIHVGEKDGVQMTAASTGIGAPSVAIIMEELANVGAHTFIRIGNSGAIADHIDLGDYVISTGAVRDEGTSKTYVAPEYPAVASYEVVQALVDSAKAAGAKYHTGIVVSVDGFYSRNKVYGPNRELLSMANGGKYTQTWMNQYAKDWKAANVLNVEMESGLIFTLAGLYGLKAGTICTVSDRTPWSEPGQDAMALDTNMAGCIDIAIDAVKKLASAS